MDDIARPGGLAGRALASGVLGGVGLGAVLGLAVGVRLPHGGAWPGRGVSTVGTAAAGGLLGAVLGAFAGLAVWVALDALRSANLRANRVVAALAAAGAVGCGLVLLAGPAHAAASAPLIAGCCGAAGTGAAVAAEWLLRARALTVAARRGDGLRAARRR